MVAYQHENKTHIDMSPLRIIEWHMMDKSKFYPLSMSSSFSIRAFLYPLNVVKTRLQIQQQKAIYSGMIDAFCKIYKTEGLGAFYKGFWISSFQVVSTILYVTTYETVRHSLDRHKVQNSTIKALVGGAAASLVAQTIIVPFDIISQHLMILGMASGKHKDMFNPLNINFISLRKYDVVKAITKEVYRTGGLRGFYKGYHASLLFYLPNSALWWTFYHSYQDALEKVMPKDTPFLILQCTAASLGGISSTIITNPLDTIRARLQVCRTSGIPETIRILWKEERIGMLFKGLEPRLFQTLFFSWIVVLGYESVKRLSVRDDYKSRVKW